MKASALFFGFTLMGIMAILSIQKSHGLEIKELNKKIDGLYLANTIVEINPDSVVITNPECEIWIDKNSVIRRTEVKSDNGKAIQWVLYLDGKILLKRNARGETQYEPYKSGDYSVWVEGYFNGKYTVISNVIHFTK